MTRPPIRLLAAFAAAASLLLPAAALGNGGDTLSTAPEMPTTVRQFSAKFGPDFWKVFLNVGDLMTIDYSSTDGDKVSFCLLPPTVTGTSVPTTPGTTSLVPTIPAATTSTPVLTDDQCAGSDTTFTKNRITLSVVNPPGYWTLVFADGLCAPHNYTTTCTTYDVAYSATLTVRHFTQTVIAFPAAAPLGRQVTLSGRVIGMTGGYVQISTQRKRKWLVVGLTPIGVNGVFSRVVRLPRDRGRYPYRVTFFGDEDHRPSGRTVAIRVG
jgi:hypothetical protein